MREDTRKRIKKIFQIGFINTIRFNLHYLGLKGLISPRIICSKKVKIAQLKGVVEFKYSGGDGIYRFSYNRYL